MNEFVDCPLRIINPSFASPLTGVVIELDHLRKLRLGGTTPAHVFFQIKEIFHHLESLESARIEGNHTTISEYIDSKIEKSEEKKEENIWELDNISKAMSFVEGVMKDGSQIDHALIRELHKIVVGGLKREGDKNPGEYRTVPVSIGGSRHAPPAHYRVQEYMDELLNFINKDDDHRYDLLKVAIAHHRFTWVHPFGNGNGRVVRLLTYALLIKFGFNVTAGRRILNPTAVFCNDRNQYYEMLSVADAGTEDGIETWCLYMLSGIRTELSKLDQIADYTFLKQKILYPALEFSEQKNIVTPLEKKILRLAIDKNIFKASDLSSALPTLTQRQRTHQIKKIIDSGMIKPVSPGARSYVINFSDNSLIRGVMKSLLNEGFTSSLD